MLHELRESDLSRQAMYSCLDDIAVLLFGIDALTVPA
jgi:hypothetical protein